MEACAQPPLGVVVETGAEPAAFLAAAEPFLREGREFLLLGIASMAAARFPATEYFIARRPSSAEPGDGGEADSAAAGAGAVVMVALRTTPTFKFLVSRGTDDGAPLALADAIADHCQDAPPTGLLGPSEVSERVAARLAERFGTGPLTAGMTERYLAATAPRDSPHGAPEGALRPADTDPASADGALLAGWCEAFEQDVALEAAMRKPGAERLMEYSDNLYVWCAPATAPGDGCGTPRPVAMAAVAGSPTPAGSQRISLVYTPPDCRRRGYAGALVRAVTALLLAADGLQQQQQQQQPYVGIVTDAANPTSNRVYESVGFEHITDGQNWWLQPPPE